MGGQTSSTGTSSGAGGAGSNCTVDAECTYQVCHDTNCVNGNCIATPRADKALALSQIYGDCRNVVCDGQGGVKTEDNGADYFDDTSECTTKICTLGVTENSTHTYGESCTGGYCDDFGRCAPCVNNANCPGQACNKSGMVPGPLLLAICVPTSCKSTTKDGTETDVDCGGECAPCADGKGCMADADCLSSVCPMATKVCAIPTCADGRKNGNETGIDCGGGAPCQSCAAGSQCTAHADCASGVCIKAICQAPTCMDGTQNGSESGIDCGGSCFACAP